MTSSVILDDVCIDNTNTYSAIGTERSFKRFELCQRCLASVCLALINGPNKGAAATKYVVNIRPSCNNKYVQHTFVEHPRHYLRHI